MAKDIIPNYSNEDFLEKVRKHNFEVAKTEKGKFQYNAVFIDLNAVKELPSGEKIGVCCNFNCPGCFKTSEKRYCLTDRLNFNEIKQVIKFAKERGVKAVVYAGLGEPMLDQDFWNALDFAHKQNLWTIVFTNGTLITKDNAKILFREKTIVIAKLNTLNRRKQDLMVGGIKNASERMLKGIKYLLETGLKAPRLCIDSYILKENAEDLKDVLRFCRKNNIIPYFESFITKNLDESDYKNKILAQKELDKLFLDLQKIDADEFNLKTKLNKGMRVYGQNPCIKYWTMFSVRANGNVALCVSDNEIIGNIRKNPLEKILVANNKKILDRYKFGCNCSITVSDKVEK